MSSYRLLTYRAQQGPRAGVLIGEQIYDAVELTLEQRYSSVLSILNVLSGMQRPPQKGEHAMRPRFGKSRGRGRYV